MDEIIKDKRGNRTKGSLNVEVMKIDGLNNKDNKEIHRSNSGKVKI